MLFHYPIIIHEEDGFWGEFPDVEGCNAQGESLEEILEDARAALDLHLLCMLMDGEPLNKPSNPMDIVCDENSFVTVITVDSVEGRLDEADSFAEESSVRLSHAEVFDSVRRKING